ncbi:MAG: hypothetical protein GY906_12155 [bacterium]|nr:hypothetical protein [bacterium]
MSADITQARDEILAVFKTAWDAGAESAGLTVLYWDLAQDPPPTGAWARVTVRHSDGNQATLSNSVGQRRFRHEGTVFVQIFTPLDEGLTLADALTSIVKYAFEGEVTSPGRVIFRRVRVNEVGRDGQWFQVNVLADFEYDDIH